MSKKKLTYIFESFVNSSLIHSLTPCTSPKSLAFQNNNNHLHHPSERSFPRSRSHSVWLHVFTKNGVVPPVTTQQRFVQPQRSSADVRHSVLGKTRQLQRAAAPVEWSTAIKKIFLINFLHTEAFGPPTHPSRTSRTSLSPETCARTQPRIGAGNLT